MGLQVRPDTGEVGVKRRYRLTNCAAYVVNAIRASLTIKTLLQLPDRATLGLHESLMRRGQADLPLPDPHLHVETGCRALGKRNARTSIPPRGGASARGNKHPRRIAEDMSYRLKRLGDRSKSRTFEQQVTETLILAAILNTYIYLGMPQSVRAGQVAPARCEGGKRAYSSRKRDWYIGNGQ